LSNQKQILISIILPTFNHAKFLKKAIESVIRQNYSNWELIIIDNNSVDETFEIINSYSDSRIKYHRIQNNGVIAASRNHGIRLSNGLWIAFIDSDDWWTNNKLSKSVEYINSDKFDLIYHDLFLVERPNQNSFKKLASSRSLKFPVFKDLLLNGNGILNSSVLVRKSILEDVGLISCDISKITWEDYDCWMRISNKSNRFCYIKETLGYYWAAGGNMTNPDQDLKNAISIYDTYIKGFYDTIPSWILFSQGKAFVKKGYIPEGISKFRKITFTNYSLKEFTKAQLKIIQCFLLNIRFFFLINKKY
jgi:glycosyltransferase involved in cell wall biosynthesis